MPSETPPKPTRPGLPAASKRHATYFGSAQCRSCGQPFSDALKPHVDHVVPYRDHPSHGAIGLEPLCAPCNLRKSASYTPDALGRLEAEAAARAGIRADFANPNVRILDNAALRQPQKDAYLATRDYFEQHARPEPALIILPTGTGKSGVIALLPFGIARGRVLVVAPNLAIRDGLLTQTLSGPQAFLRRRQVLPEEASLPHVIGLGRGYLNHDDCQRAHIIVANVQQLQGWVHLFPEDFFDLLIIDEGHHMPARSWQRIRDAFPEARNIYLTGTPYRADKRPIQAHTVFQYSLASAIAEGYVKTIHRVQAIATELTFTLEDSTRQLSLDEILAMREETWFTRGVALSEPSNRSIVAKSVELWQRKQARGTEHKIIGAACSIRHAKRLALLFSAYGVRATWVASQEMRLEERLQRLADFETGRYHAIVHVGLLGEGYDHPKLSIAAIFRPFRSLAPYAQFIGRVIRRLPKGDEQDNQAHVIDHVGLNLDPLWENFRKEHEESEALRELDDMADAWTFEDRPPWATPRPPPLPPPRMDVVRETIQHYKVDGFGEGHAPGVQDKLHQLATLVRELQASGLPLPDMEQLLPSDSSPPQEAPAPPNNRPDLERESHRRLLATDIQHLAAQLLHERRLRFADKELTACLAAPDAKNNYEAVVRDLHRRINQAVGCTERRSQRATWSIALIRKARAQLPAVCRDLGNALDEVLRSKENPTPIFT